MSGRLRALILIGLISLLLTPSLVTARGSVSPDLAPQLAGAEPAAPIGQVLQFTPTPPPSSCSTPSASASPANLAEGTPVTISANGFGPRSTVTIAFSGPTQKPTTTTQTDPFCHLSYTVQTTGDVPGTYQVTLRGFRYNGGDAALLLTAQYVISTPTATQPPLPPTNTTAPASAVPVTAAPTCRLPSAAMLSSRIAPGQTATVIARGFQPGAVVQIDVDGPTGRYTSVVSQAVGSNCEVTQSFITNATDLPGHYTVNVTGPTAASAYTTARTEFDLVVGVPPASPTPTLLPGVPPPPPPTGPEPPVPPGALAPVAVESSLAWVGGSAVPVVGEIIQYEYVLRLTNTAALAQETEYRAAALDVPFSDRDTNPGTWNVEIVAQGDTLVLSASTQLSPDTTLISSNTSAGQSSMQGSTLVFEGRLTPGDTMTLTANLQQVPTTAGVVNEPVRSQSVSATNQRGQNLAVRPPPRPLPPTPQRFVQPPPPPVDPVTGPRFFSDSGFSVADDNIWVFFNRRGGARTFGAPISRVMLLNGARVQLFEKGILQVFDDGQVVSVNLLEPPYLPFESFGDLTLPPVDDALIAFAPDPAAPDFATNAQEFVRANAPEQFEGLTTRFYGTFLGTVLFRDAFFDGQGDPNLVPGFDLEIWGLPTSQPAFRAQGTPQVDPSTALLRFQRGLMIHDSRASTTTAVSLGYYVRAIIAGDTSQPGLAEGAAFSPLWAQYDPDALNWVARPDELGDTNLVLVFTREDGLGEAVPIAPRASVQLLIRVLEATPTYNDAGATLGDATPGDRYRVLLQLGGWVQAVREGDTPDAAVWIELDGRVQASIE